MKWRWVAAALGLCAVALAFTPYTPVELLPFFFRWHLPWAPPPLIQRTALVGPTSGAGVDGFWRVQQVAPETFAIGEPQDSPDNYEYLLIGTKRALLFDAGATRRDIHPALTALTRLPVTVIPSHLHYDHTNGLKNFQSIALIDVPETRSRVQPDGAVHLSRYEYLDMFDRQGSPVFRVTEWVKPDTWLDLGGRQVQVLLTPGHTATSVSLFEPDRKLFFSGDLLVPNGLWTFMPDSSVPAYHATMVRLQALLPPDTTLWTAHCCRNDAASQAPWLKVADIRDLAQALQGMQDGSVKGRGVWMRRYPVNPRMTLLTVYPLGNR